MNWLVKKILAFTGSQKFLSIQLDITNACNLSCLHCYQTGHSAGDDLSFEDWLKILDQYGKLTNKLFLLPNFCISGGEPTLSPIFPRILEVIHARWPTAGIDVLTNGTNITPDIASIITSHKAGVQISIEGPDAVRHDYVRGPGNFVRAMAGCKTLRDSGVSVIFQTVLSNRTAPWVPELFALAAERDAAAMNFTRFIQQGRGKSFSETAGEQPLLGAALKEAYTAILSASSKTGIPTGTNQPLFVLISPEHGAHGKFGFQGLVVDYKGNLKVSSRADFRLGSILESGMEELFLRHPVMKELRAGHIEKCGECRFYDSCAGDRNAAYAVYGSFLKKDPGCWL